MQDDDTFSQSTHMNIPLLDPHAQPIVKIREIDIERPALGSRQRKNEFEPYVNGDLSNISQYTIKNIDVPSHPLPNKQMKIKSESNVEDKLSILCNTTPLDYNDICWPEWLDLEKVNDMEKLALPEFFNDHQEDYIKYRNYMVEQYYSNPGYYLTISTCKQAFPDADLLSLVRIHSFLEIYDVINSQNDPRRRIFNPIIDSEPEAHMEINPQRSLEKVDNVDLPYLRKLMYDATRLDKIRSAWDIKVEDPMNVDQQLIFKCYHCQQKCNSIRYQNLKRSDFHLCIDCFVNGRFPSVYSSNDFLRISEEANMNNSSSKWTDEEILRLLEGVDQYDDDWLMVSEHVGNRTKEQCIMQFLQMPITDEFFNIKLSENELEEVPFANTPNPIMTMVTYLAAHINPGVAGVAAKVAMKELLDASKNEKLTGKDGDKKKIKSENMEEDVDIKIEDENDDNDNMNTGQNGDENKPAFSKEVTSTATYAALKAAALQARKLSSYEDQEIQHWIRLAVKTMVDKLNLKIQQYEEFDQALENDYQEAEKTNTSLQTSLDSLRQQHFPLPSVSNPQHTMTNVVPTPSTSNNN
ncbi:SWIRM domain-containing protein [Cunninghamella echinulata]|nr:SWIRM domain-containing protein [Cunninghamella echinulata]